MGYETLSVQDDQHLDDLLRLWRDNMSDRRVGSVLHRRRDWLYEGNPAGAAVTSMVIDKKTDRIVGAASAYPRMFHVDGETVKGGILADFVVEEGHRVAGPAIMVQRSVAQAAMARDFRFLCGYPNQGASPIFARLRYKKIGETTTWVKPLKVAPQLEKFIHPLAARLAGLVLDRFLDADDLRCVLARPRDGRPREWEGFDARFDDLWFRARGRHAAAGVRDADYLRWRYAEHPTQRYGLFALERSGGFLLGYVVYHVRDRRVLVDDVFGEGGAARDEALLLSFCRRMRRKGYASVSVTYVGDAQFESSLAAMRFLRRPGKRPFMAYAGPEAAGWRDVVHEGDSWSMHDGELDI